MHMFIFMLILFFSFAETGGIWDGGNVLPPLEIQCITSIVISHFFMHSTFMLILVLQFWYPVIHKLHNEVEFATV